MPASPVSPVRGLSCVALLLLAGCAGSGTAGGLSAGQRLERLAMRETGRSAAANAASIPVPPGTGDAMLRPRPASDAAARLPLEAVLAEVVATPEDPAADPAQPDQVDVADRDAALGHYAKGRDAALRNRHLVAITELEKAAELDPHSAAILRQLARSYVAMGNDTRATTVFERLIEIEPDDSETLFVLGLAATNRRDFARAASFLGRPRLAGGHFDHDPAANCLADFMLGTALRQLGYDRAWIRLAQETMAELDAVTQPTLYRFRFESLYRQRSEIWRGVGDAHCRLGEHELALEAYRRSAALPNADPEALYGRVIYANLCLGRERSAEAALLDALGRSVSEQTIRLCGYVHESVGATPLLAQAVVDRHLESPDDPALVRAAAILLPRDDAVLLLRSFLRRRPADLDVLGQLQGWLVARDPRSAVTLTVALAEDHPLLGADYGDRLARTGASPTALFELADQLAPSPARSLVKCRLLVYMGANGRAWTVCDDGVQRWPDDLALHLQRVHLAVRLEEPRLIEQALAELAPFRGAAVALAEARGRRVLGHTELAVRAAAEAVELAPGDAEALIELATAHVAHAENLRDPDGRLQHANNAVLAAQRALELDSRRDDAYAILMALHAPNALLGDRAQLNELRRALIADNGDGSLAARLDAQQEVMQGRYERAIERLTVVCDADPTDAEALELLMAIWTQSGGEREALAWIERHLAERPADPALLDEMVSLLVGQQRGDEALARLEAVLAAEPAHDDARLLLETLHRSAGRMEQALALAETRLMTRPLGIRRELELAAAYAGAEMDEPAAARLEWILHRADEAKFDQMVSALGVAGRVSDRNPRFDPLALAYAERIVARFPDAPIQVYGSGLRAMARLGIDDERFDAMADRAARHARGATGGDIQAADLWRQLAQALVESGHPAAAGRALRARLLADTPLEPPALTLLTVVTLVTDAAAGDEEASMELIQGMAMRGKLPDLWGRGGEADLAEVYFDTSTIFSTVGDQAGCERLLRETVRLAPDHAMALNNLGYTRLELGYGDEQTRQWINRAYELAPNDSNVLDTVGWLNYKSGRFGGPQDEAGALALIRESLAQSQEPSAEVLDHLGDTLWRLGDADAALEAWRRAAEVVTDARQRRQMEDLYTALQARQWGLRVADPADLYDLQFGEILERALRKIDAADGGADPPVAATFEEMGVTGPKGGSRDGRP